MFQHFAHLLCAFSELFLKFANQLVILAFSVGEIVVGQLSVLLLELALDFIPGALELEFVHINYSGLGGTVGCIRSAGGLYSSWSEGLGSRFKKAGAKKSVFGL
jgi:hypothetical protein